jgi:hypothetical protein
MADSRDYRQGIFRDLTGIMNAYLWRNVQIETMLIRHQKKIRRKQRFRRIVVVRIVVVALPPYALFIASFTAAAVIGSERTRAPEALKIAFASAGAITVTAGSPTPVGFSPLAMTLMATSGS